MSLHMSQGSPYQPYLPQDLTVTLLTPCTPNCFLEFLDLTLMVCKSFNGTGILHYFIAVSVGDTQIYCTALHCTQMHILLLYKTVD